MRGTLITPRFIRAPQDERYELEIDMKTIGIIGGIGPESTVDYYKEIIAAFHTKYSDLAYPEIIVYSVNMNVLISSLKLRIGQNFLSGY